MHVLFGCDNYDTLRQDIFKKIKVVDSTKLDTVKLQKLKILLMDRSFKSLNIFSHYIYGIFENLTTGERRVCLIPYIFNLISGTSQLSCSRRWLIFF